MTTMVPRGTRKAPPEQKGTPDGTPEARGGGSLLTRLLAAGGVAVLVGVLTRRRERPQTAEPVERVVVTGPRRTGRGARPRPIRSSRTARAAIALRTLRTDRWWVQPAITAAVLLAFVGYSTFRAFQNAYYFSAPYISPFYSPCLTTRCQGDSFPKLFTGPSWISPALYILIVPLGFRLTCYYYRKAYYRSFWLSPPACAVGEPHKRYTGETRPPLIAQNVHRYFFYLGLLFNGLLTYDAVLAFRSPHGAWGHAGLGTLVLVVNAVLLWLYSLSCHSCRHIVGGRLNHFSRHPLRYRFWTAVSALNARHVYLAWVSLIGVALTDGYVFLVASHVFADPRFF